MAQPKTFKNMIGLRFARLLVVAQAESDKNGNARWRCRCDCGSETISRGFTLRNGQAKSCGCLTTEQLKVRIKTHGLSHKAEYRVWAGMIQRCDNPKVRKFHLYGARGIRVCKEWYSFEVFYQDMGPRPSSKHSIERRDSNGNYCLDNCYWATASEQANNTAQNRKVVYQGKEMNLVQAIRAAGNVVCFSTVESRLRYGWDIEDAVELPPFTPR